MIVFNLEVLLTAWDERNNCAVSHRRKRTGCKWKSRNWYAEVKAGAETLSSRQELKCWSQIRSWNAVVRTRIKILKSKQKLKISNLFLRGSVGLEEKMNDERMISQTPMVHKLDVLSSWCLAVCSKYVREGQWRRVKWRRVNVVSHVGWSFLLLGGEERECALSCWLVCPPARRRREEYVLCHVGLLVLLLASGETSRENVLYHVDWSVLSLAGQEAKRGREMVSVAFNVAPGMWPGQNGISHSHWAKYIFELQRPKQFTHKIIIWNSFCYTWNH